MSRLSHPAGGIRGFTLLELLVVIVIIGLLPKAMPSFTVSPARSMISIWSPTATPRPVSCLRRLPASAAPALFSISLVRSFRAPVSAQPEVEC